VKTKKFAVELCNQEREDYIVIRLWSGSGHKMVHHHLRPNEAMRLAHGILSAIENPR